MAGILGDSGLTGEDMSSSRLEWRRYLDESEHLVILSVEPTYLREIVDRQVW